MIVERSMHPGWLSNAYLIAAAPSGPAAFIDSGAPLEPLLQAVSKHDLRPTHLLTTHGHPDHVEGHKRLLDEFDLDVLAHPAEGVEAATDINHGTTIEIGDLRVEALHTPGHSPGHTAFVADGAAFTADVLFRDSVGGTRTAFDDVRSSVMDVLMQLPGETVVYPGHTDESTIGREWEQNPFVRVWRGLDPVRVGLLFPGEMGAQIGDAARAEVVWASEGRSRATAERAERAGLVDVGSVAELVGSSDAVLSVCPPAIAEDVAAQVFALGFTGVYVDANAVSPGRMARIAKLGSQIVDGSIIARGGIHLYLAGRSDDMEQVAALFDGTAVVAIRLGRDVGAASALKMAFGGWNKIGIALTAQAHAIARAYDVGEWLEAEGVPPDRLGRMADRAWRWAPEMDEIGDLCGELGLSEAIPRGAASFYRDVSRG